MSEEKNPSLVIGGDAAKPVVGPFTEALATKQKVTTLNFENPEDPNSKRIIETISTH